MPFGAMRHSLIHQGGTTGSTTGQGTPGDGSTPSTISNWSYSAAANTTISTAYKWDPDAIAYGKDNFSPEPFGVAYVDDLSTSATTESARVRLRNVTVGSSSIAVSTGAVVTIPSGDSGTGPWNLDENDKIDLVSWGENVSGNYAGRGAVFMGSQIATGFQGSSVFNGTVGRSINITSSGQQINSGDPTYDETRLIGATTTPDSGGEIDVWFYNDANNPMIQVNRFDQTGDNDNYLTGSPDATQMAAGEPESYHRNCVAALSASYSSCFFVSSNSFERDVLMAFDGTNIIKKANVFDYQDMKGDSGYVTGVMFNEGGFDKTNQRGVCGYYDESTYELDMVAYNVTTSINTGSKYTVTLPTGAVNVGLAYGTYDGYGTLYYNVGQTIYLRKMTVDSSNQISLSSAYSFTGPTGIAVLGMAQQQDIGSPSTTVGNVALVGAQTGSNNTLRLYGFTFT
jgi:hypothetical protein